MPENGGRSGYYDYEEGVCYDEETWSNEDYGPYHEECLPGGEYSPGYTEGCEDWYFYHNLGEKIKDWWDSLWS